MMLLNQWYVQDDSSNASIANRIAEYMSDHDPIMAHMMGRFAMAYEGTMLDTTCRMPTANHINIQLIPEVRRIVFTPAPSMQGSDVGTTGQTELRMQHTVLLTFAVVTSNGCKSLKDVLTILPIPKKQIHDMTLATLMLEDPDALSRGKFDAGRV